MDEFNKWLHRELARGLTGVAEQYVSPPPFFFSSLRRLLLPVMSYSC